MNVPARPASRWSAAARWSLVGVAALGAVSLVYLVAKGGAGPIATPTTTLEMSSASKRPPNRLAQEKSPYLLQHARNPVDWYPWGEEAFARARREDKPIFLSIGYSTCHWCHVMERESFENDSVAALINRYFVPIKVDREERPDVDHLYMTAMNTMGMGGGWPLNVFLTPDLEPFFGGTYFPPGGSAGRRGLIELLPQVHQAWVDQRAQIEASGKHVFEALASLQAPDTGNTERRRLLNLCYQQLSASFDSTHGGFGSGNKFPSISNLNFLMRYGWREPEARAQSLEMVTRQLDAMRAGGIHDHLGGGFHRYTTEPTWLVPHFEKMLYDQAQIAWAYLEAYQATGRVEYAATARDIFAYVARDLTSPEGAFYSAEDADSEGEEGKFYVWTPAELESALGKDEAALFGFRYGVTAEGNFEHRASILHHAHTLEEAARKFDLAPAATASRLEHAARRLLEVRSRRVRPYRDDKVLTAWNGLMISALARGASVLGDEKLERQATRAADFIWQRLYDERSGDLKRRWRDGEAAAQGQLADYAYYALGLIDLYRASLDPRWLERAVQMMEAAIPRFWDEKDGGFFASPAGDPHLKLRLKEDFDGAEMAGVSIATLNLQMLGTLLDRDDWRKMARHALDAYARRLERIASAMPQMLVAMDLEQTAPRHVVIAGRPEAKDTREMVAEFNRRFLPHDELLFVDGGARQKRLAVLVPFIAALTAKDGKATAYVCVNYSCRLPTTEPVAFAAQLEEEARVP